MQIYLLNLLFNILTEQQTLIQYVPLLQRMWYQKYVGEQKSKNFQRQQENMKE